MKWMKNGIAFGGDSESSLLRGSISNFELNSPLQRIVSWSHDGTIRHRDESLFGIRPQSRDDWMAISVRVNPAAEQGLRARVIDHLKTYLSEHPPE